MPNLVELDVRDRELDRIFLNRFRVRRGNFSPLCTIRSGSLVYDRSNYSTWWMYEDDEDHLEYLLEKHGGDLDEALTQLAHSIVRDESGEIQELDLQWMRITPSGLARLQQLGGLRRLKIGHPLQNTELFNSVAQLRSLRVLEIPTPWITDAGLAEIGKLRQLTRLQLPLRYFNPSCPRPEQIPFPSVREGEAFQLGEYEQLLTSRALLIMEMDDYHHVTPASVGVNVEQVSPESRLTESGMAHLAALEQLEYLFMPGFLLSHRTLDTLEALPRLRHLHALFSLASPELLKRLAALDLESLSVGVGDVDAETVRVLGEMPRLAVLQLLVFNRACAEDKAMRESAAAQLHAALPNCELHVQFLPSP